MTEAISRREIEDILTSIRKLVSHDPAGLGLGVRTPSASAVQDPAPVGKLVLTSALRVSDETSPAVDTAPESTISPLAALPEPEALAEPEQPAPFAVDESQAASLLSRITRSAGSVPEPEVHDHGLASTISNFNAAPQTPPSPLADVQDWLDDADIPVPDQTAQRNAFFAEPEIDPTDDATMSEGLTDSAGLEETLARLEAALSGQPVTPPMQDTPSSDSAPKAAPTSASPEDADDSPMIDEAMLYQLVANIVRQELQGELGEKITRAIRKLVRSEVARELQLRNM